MKTQPLKSAGAKDPHFIVYKQHNFPASTVIARSKAIPKASRIFFSTDFSTLCKVVLYEKFSFSVGGKILLDFE